MTSLAFIVGSILGSLISAAIISAYHLRNLRTMEEDVNHLKETQEAANALQHSMINNFRAQLKAYQAETGHRLGHVHNAYKILVAYRDNDVDYDIDEAIGYLGQALE
jgi:hypothetical protein